jgi:hypothetical protein
MLSLVNDLDASTVVISTVLQFGDAIDWPDIGSIELQRKAQGVSLREPNDPSDPATALV